MPKRSFKGDKRRRQLQKKKKREDKLARKQNKGADGSEGESDDNAYLEYLNPGGPMDERFTPEEDDEGDDEEESVGHE